MTLSAPIHQLKRRAKTMAREANIPLNEALNRIAATEGFTAWSLLAAQWSKRDLAPHIFARLEAGDLVVIGARPMQGKTLFALHILALAHKAGRFVAYFTLEQSQKGACDTLISVGVDPVQRRVLVDTSDAISADHMIEKLKGAKAGSMVVVDYLQALDHHRSKPPLADQIAALKAFARASGVTFVFIAQIDRQFDATDEALPDLDDLRLPNRIDTGVFDKACFLREGALSFGGQRIAA